MGRPNTTIKNWLRAISPEQAAAVAKRAQTSVPYLRHVAAGRRALSADLAQRMAHADSSLNQRDLCQACNRCPLLPKR